MALVVLIHVAQGRNPLAQNLELMVVQQFARQAYHKGDAFCFAHEVGNVNLTKIAGHNWNGYPLPSGHLTWNIAMRHRHSNRGKSSMGHPFSLFSISRRADLTEKNDQTWFPPRIHGNIVNGTPYYQGLFFFFKSPSSTSSICCRLHPP